jgi:DNA-binding PadR family transcriptional regulator
MAGLKGRLESFILDLIKESKIYGYELEKRLKNSGFHSTKEVFLHFYDICKKI